MGLLFLNQGGKQGCLFSVIDQICQGKEKMDTPPLWLNMYGSNDFGSNLDIEVCNPSFSFILQSDLKILLTFFFLINFISCVCHQTLKVRKDRK